MSYLEDEARNIVYSPITGGTATLFEKVSIDNVIAQYKKMGVDVSHFFKATRELAVYQCDLTKYRFFYPAIVGDEKFYENIQEISGYYNEWKWENEEAVKFIQNGDTVLDIGCGEGFFLERIRQLKESEVFGLEFNEKSVKKCETKKIPVQKMSVEDFASANRARFDVVCSFQVLEHIADVKVFIESIIQTLRPSGLLIIGVPNNNPYIFYTDKYHTLNLPPHHVGLWNKQSLIELGKLFGLEVMSIKQEPSQSYLHFYRELYLSLCAENSASKIAKTFYTCLDQITRMRFLRNIYWQIIKLSSKHLTGHSILSVYRKPDNRTE